MGLSRGKVQWGRWGSGNAVGQTLLEGLTLALDAAPSKAPQRTAWFSGSSSTVIYKHPVQKSHRQTKGMNL